MHSKELLKQDEGFYRAVKLAARKGGTVTFAGRDFPARAALDWIDGVDSAGAHQLEQFLQLHLEEHGEPKDKS